MLASSPAPSSTTTAENWLSSLASRPRHEASSDFASGSGRSTVSSPRNGPAKPRCARSQSPPDSRATSSSSPKRSGEQGSTKPQKLCSATSVSAASSEGSTSGTGGGDLGEDIAHYLRPKRFFHVGVSVQAGHFLAAGLRPVRRDDDPDHPLPLRVLLH